MSNRPSPSVRERRAPADAHLAGVRERVLAYLLDGIVFGGFALLVAAARRRTVAGRLRLAGTVALVGGFVYHILLEGTWGRTVGKRLVGIAVVGEDGGPCTYRAATIRTALRTVDWLPAGYLAGLVSIATTERRQRLGDLLAGTVVVRAARDRERNRD